MQYKINSDKVSLISYQNILEVSLLAKNIKLEKNLLNIWMSVESIKFCY